MPFSGLAARGEPVAVAGRFTVLASVTALIYLIDAVALMCGAMLHTSGTNAPQMLGALAVIALGLVAYVIARGRRFRSAEATAMLAIQLIAVASMSRTTHLDLAALSNGFGLSMLGAYASWLLARPGAVVFYCGLALWVSAVVARDNLYLTSAAVLLLAQVTATTEIVRALRNRVRRLTDFDPLTGVLNRRGVDGLVRELMASSTRSGAPICVALMDLDGLKQVNNTAGHFAGDALLVTATSEWRRALRRSAVTVGRIGGDEFVLLFQGTEEAAARATIASLSATSTVPWSVGLAQLRPGEAFSEGLARADAEMYVHKANKLTRHRAADLSSPAPLVDDHVQGCPAPGPA